MHIDKQQIISMLRERGDDDRADEAERELPDQVHHEEHRGKLEQFGLDPQEILGKLKDRF